MQQRYINFYVDLMLSDLYRNYLFIVDQDSGTLANKSLDNQLMPQILSIDCSL